MDLRYYAMVGAFFTHELDAMSNHEWRLIPGLNALSDPVGEVAFLLAHVPVFAVVIAFIASLNTRIRRIARNVTSGFLVVHAALHALFSVQSDYEFSGWHSSLLIYGAALCGAAYFILLKRRRSN